MAWAGNRILELEAQLKGKKVIHLLLELVGVALYLVQAYIPMAPPIKTVITVVVVLCLCLWLLQVFGISDIPVPRVR